MPPKGKKSANQHDKRHESGLAAPGKRITKQRSNTNLNGHTNGKLPSSAIPPPLPSTGLNQGITFPRPVTSPTETAHPDAPLSSRETADSGDHLFGASYGFGEEKESYNQAAPATMEVPTSDPKCGGPESNAFKSVASQASSALTLAATILTSCPLRDAIAILILLLSLPPTLVITIHTLFASLTFVPPTAGISLGFWNSKPSMTDWFHATAAGGPSLFVISIVDAMVTIFYLCSPTSFQNVYLDLAQAVIAISLSGATAGKGGPANSLAACGFIISLVHLLRYRAIHLTGLNYLKSILHNLGFTGMELPVFDHSSAAVPSHGWARLLLGCHILAQGIVTLVRRGLAGSGNSNRPASNKRQDSESAPNDGTRIGPGGEVSQDTPSNSSTDGRPPGLPPATPGTEKKVSSNKKKRKQANQVRSQQPLWAAVASTKVTFLKEMEQKQSANDELEVQAMTARQAGIATLEDRVYIKEVQSTEITFRADIANFAADEKARKDDGGGSVSAGIDKTKPLFVRINGADWVNTKIEGAATSGESDEKSNDIWDGKIYGLAPLTNYKCEFVRLSDQKVLYSASLITLPAPYTEQASIVPAPPPQPQSLRPASPISTLKQSLAAAEAKLNEYRNRLKKARRDHRTNATAIRREIDQLRSKVESSGGTDERSRQRILQLTRDISHNNDAADEAMAEAEALGEIPEENMTEAEAKRRAWQAASDAKKAVVTDFDTVKAEVNRETAQLNAEVTAVAQKRERQIGRQQKLNENHDRLLAEKNADLTARQRHDLNRNMELSARSNREAELRFWTEQSKAEAEDLGYKIQDTYAQINHISSILSQRQVSLSTPTTPEGNLPGTNGFNRQLAGLDYPPFGFPHNHSADNMVRGGRGRSSSMLSGYSGFTEDLDIVPQGGGPVFDDHHRKHSDGSSASAGSNEMATSPRPIGAPASIMSPIGSKGKQPMSPIGSHR